MESSSVEKNLAALEALLFLYGEPVEIKRLSKILEIDPDGLEALINRLDAEYRVAGRGLCITRQGSRIQLTTKSELGAILNRVIQDEFQENLTSAATETLSLIAYAGPLSRAQIEYIRGVNSSFILRSLLMRGLIERSAAEQRQNVYLYSVSFDLFKKLGLARMEELPEYERYRTLIEQFLTPQPESQENPHVAN